MYPILYSPGHTDFNNLGLGVMVDTTTATVTEELNGKFELDLQYLSDGPLAKALVYDALVKVPTGDQVDQLFRIKTIIEKIDGVLSVHAEHVSYIINDLPIKPNTKVVESVAQVALNKMLSAIADKHPLTVYSDITTISSAEWKVPDFKNPRNILGGVEGSILDQWGGEYQFDNYQIRLTSQRGRYSNTIIAYGRNLTDFEQEESILETYTSIYPYANETSNDSTVLRTLPEFFVDSEYVDKYPNRRVAMVDFSEKFNEKNPYSEDKLRKFAQSYVKANKVGVPKVTMKVSTVDLSGSLDESYNVEEVESLHLADTVKVFFEPLGVTAEAKVVGSVWNVLLEQYDSYTLGAKKASFGQWVNNNVNEIKNAADSAKQTAINAAISANGKNTNYYGNSGDGFPANPKVGDLYFQRDGDKTTVYQWDGTSWVNIIDGNWQTDFEQEMQDKLDQAKQENDAAIADLDKQLSDAQTAIDNVEAANDAVVKAVDQAQQDIKTVDDAAAKALAEAMTGQGMATIVQNDLNNTKTVVSQLSDSITLAVQKNDVINQINVSTEGILIAGEKVHITGTTLIDDAIITTAMIKELDASVITTGTLAANIIVPTAGNLLMNSEFQSNTFFDGWTQGASNSKNFYESTSSYTDAYGGKSYATGVQTQTAEVTLSNWSTLYQDVKAREGLPYSGSVVIRNNTMNPDVNGDLGRMGLDIEFLDSNKKPIAHQNIEVTTIAPYATLSLENQVGPKGTAYLRFKIYAAGKVNGYATRSMLNRGAKTLPYTASTGQVIVGSDMIVDGAIIAKHLSAESVTAEKLAVGAVNMGSATVTGTLDANRINVINLDASQIKVGTLNAATVRIINLDASAITTGTLNVAVQINANSIVSGSLNAKLLTGDTAHLNSVDTGVITNRIDDHLQLGAYNATENVGQINITSRTATNVDYPGGTTIYSNPYDSGERWGIRLYRNRIMPLNRSQDAALELNPYTKGAVNVRNRDQDTWLPVNASKFNVISERKFKNKIQVFKDSALEIINDTTIYSYEKSGRKEIGVISDEANGALLSKGQDGERFVDLYSYSSIAIKAIQELTDEVDSLKSQIEEMEKKIA
ncbi:phage tail spike protein [Lactococcus formosensis]|uniref:phage tail spike protein n=1 Tax=Lactococcus formosensis TaxID=1281486 RepID=UPI0028908BE6|nr:phage tail spike protein [Lactococcus formosensis]MDT2726491.1 phage tail spike protein [Lactococcus formosensis]